MTLRILPNALALSEFQGYSGDCTQDAELACLHCLDAARWPLDAATLDNIVAANVAAGTAAASGAETLDAVAADFVRRGATVEQHGYQEPLQYDWHSRLTQTAGYAPVLLQVANGAAFGHQGNLQYHAVAVLGHDDVAQVYYCADGDSPDANAGKLSQYTLAQLYASNPCGLIVAGLPPAPPAPPVPVVDLARVRTALAQLQAAVAALAALIPAAG